MSSNPHGGRSPERKFDPVAIAVVTAMLLGVVAVLCFLELTGALYFSM